jgi:hypothetical protein
VPQVTLHDDDSLEDLTNIDAEPFEDTVVREVVVRTIGGASGGDMDAERRMVVRLPQLQAAVDACKQATSAGWNPKVLTAKNLKKVRSERGTWWARWTGEGRGVNSSCVRRWRA